MQIVSGWSKRTPQPDVRLPNDLQNAVFWQVLIGVIEGEQVDGKRRFGTIDCLQLLRPITCTLGCGKFEYTLHKFHQNGFLPLKSRRLLGLLLSHCFSKRTTHVGFDH